MTSVLKACLAFYLWVFVLVSPCEKLLAEGELPPILQLDDWNIFRIKTLNRQLHLQKDVTREDPFFNDKGQLALDTSIGGQVALGEEGQSRFHGYFINDMFLQLQPIDVVTLNLNLTLLNPSASDGFRFSSDVLPGVGFHFRKDFELLKNKWVLDIMSTDLDLVTIGAGLMMENLPTEGYYLRLCKENGKLCFEEVFSGRAFWDDDDVFAFTGTYHFNKNHSLAVHHYRWLTDNLGVGVADPEKSPRRRVDYFSLSARLQNKNVRARGEWAFKSQGFDSIGSGLLRLDFRKEYSRLNFLIGTQSRLYLRRFGPRSRFVPPSTAPNLPYRERTLVTDPFEFWAYSQGFNQFSQTIALQAQYKVSKGLRFIGDGEYWVRDLWHSENGPKPFAELDPFGFAPGYIHHFTYRVGLELFKKENDKERYRARVVATNKLVDSGFRATEFRFRRFFYDPILLFEAETFF